MTFSAITVVAVDILLCACALPWMIVGWLRIWRYVRCFQANDYDGARYLTWLRNDRRERKQLIVGLVIVLSEAMFIALDFILQPSQLDLWMWVVANAVVALAIFTFAAPRGYVFEYQYAITRRTVFLTVVIAIIQMSLPVLVNTGISIYIQKLPPLLEVWLIGGMVSGVLLYTFLPLLIPLANFINWPIDRLLRIPRNMPTSTGSNL